MRWTAVAAAGALLAAANAEGVTFADGEVHVIDSANSFPLEDVRVADSPEGEVTSVIVTTGGLVGAYLSASGSSHVTILGGEIGRGVELTDDAVATIGGGQIGGQSSGKALTLHHRSKATVTGGQFNGVETFDDEASLDFSGGVSADWFISGASIRISGGQITRIQYQTGGNLADITISGGEIGSITKSGRGTFFITGGRFTGVVESREERIDISGGQFLGELAASSEGEIAVSGTAFNFPPGDIVPLSGVLAGILRDGNAINTAFARSSTGRILLISTAVIDSDGDEIPDGLDNCPSDSNTGQEDADADGEGDVCDPFPDDPHNGEAQCQLDLALALIELEECRDNSVFPDADADGEHDQTDYCPGTEPGAAVDTAGCSLPQFCSSKEVSKAVQRPACNRADWKNDEPVGNAKDCIVARAAVSGKPIALHCVPR